MLARLKVDSRIRAETAPLTEIMVNGKIVSGFFEYVSCGEADVRISGLRLRSKMKRNRRIERALRLLYITLSVQELH